MLCLMAAYVAPVQISFSLSLLQQVIDRSVMYIVWDLDLCSYSISMTVKTPSNVTMGVSNLFFLKNQ